MYMLSFKLPFVLYIRMHPYKCMHTNIRTLILCNWCVCVCLCVCVCVWMRMYFSGFCELVPRFFCVGSTDAAGMSLT